MSNSLEERISAETASAAVIRSPSKSGNKSKASGFSAASLPKNIACSILVFSFFVLDSTELLESEVNPEGAVISIDIMEAVDVRRLKVGMAAERGREVDIPRNRLVDDRKGNVSSNVAPV
jgi:hypothetical protein